MDFPVERNPLLAEKTPRHPVFSDWNYKPLSARPEFENLNYQMPKWNHPPTDHGLLSKLNTQAPKYAQEKQWEDEMYKKIEDHHKTMTIKKAEEERRKREEKVETGRVTNRDSDGYTIPTVRSASTVGDHAELHGPSPEEATGLTTRRSMESERLPTTRSQMSTGRRFYTQPISTFKSLNIEHPEILNQWRANRAAEYITTLKEPLDAPSTTRIALKNNPHGGFKPSSTKSRDLEKASQKFIMKKSTGKLPTSKVDRAQIQTLSSRKETPVSTARMREEVKTLQKALQDTNEEIERQQLKINLNTKTKNYERIPERLKHSARSTMSSAR